VGQAGRCAVEALKAWRDAAGIATGPVLSENDSTVAAHGAPHRGIGR
jgi:hypothetical protein